MGALSFAAGTLASLSSAFAPRHVTLARADLANLSLILDNDADRIFNEFSTGMKMLFQYGSRNPCNISHITHQNLKLLYTNLKANSSFRKVVSNIKESASGTQHAIWLKLVFNSTVSAKILYLPAGTSISPIISGSDLKTLQGNIQTSDGTDWVSPNFRQLYLTLLGNVQIRNSSVETVLKLGEPYADCSTRPEIKQIAAFRGDSLMLNIQLPAS